MELSIVMADKIFSRDGSQYSTGDEASHCLLQNAETLEQRHLIVKELFFI